MIFDERTILFENGFFERKFFWDKDVLKSLEDGFLIQKVERNTIASNNFKLPSSINNPFCHVYFEAWEIREGEIAYADDFSNDFDDQWGYNVSNLIDTLGAVLKDYSSKYKTSGTITMQGTLFFLPKHHQVTSDLINCFSVGKVEYAKDLLSCYECDVEKYFASIYKHTFSHKWELWEDDAFITAIANELKKHNLNLEECISYLEPCFNMLPVYPTLTKTILSTYNMRIAENG